MFIIVLCFAMRNSLFRYRIPPKPTYSGYKFSDFRHWTFSYYQNLLFCFSPSFGKIQPPENLRINGGCLSRTAAPCFSEESTRATGSTTQRTPSPCSTMTTRSTRMSGWLRYSNHHFYSYLLLNFASREGRL